MKSLIRVCPGDEHDEAVYTLSEACPDCGTETQNTAPPRFSPEDTYGNHRRLTKWKR